MVLSKAMVLLTPISNKNSFEHGRRIKQWDTAILPKLGNGMISVEWNTTLTLWSKEQEGVTHSQGLCVSLPAGGQTWVVVWWAEGTKQHGNGRPGKSGKKKNRNSGEERKFGRGRVEDKGGLKNGQGRGKIISEHHHGTTDPDGYVPSSSNILHYGLILVIFQLSMLPLIILRALMNWKFGLGWKEKRIIIKLF